MKKLLFSCLIFAALFTSCSDDDISGSSSPVASVTQKVYWNGEIEDIFKAEYSNNGQLIKQTWYNNQNVQVGYTDFTYNNGLLSKTEDHYQGSLLTTRTYTYDSEGRMTMMNYDTDGDAYDYQTTFTHDSSTNSIISVSTGSFGYSARFYLNNNGNVYKEVRDGITYELNYNGAIPESATENGSLTTFEYDATHDASLLNISMGEGSFKVNAVLRANRLADVTTTIANQAGKYLIKQTGANGIRKSVYTFNEKGLPVKKMDYSGDELTSEMDFFYK